MRVTTKGQVTIPQDVRYDLGIEPASEVLFVREKGRVYLVAGSKAPKRRAGKDGFERARGSATVKMSTDEIMRLTRGEDWGR